MPLLLIEMQKLLSTIIKLFCKESSSFRIALVSSLCAQPLLLHCCRPAFWRGFRRSAMTSPSKFWGKKKASIADAFC